MSLEITDWSLLVHCAAIAQIIGFYFRDQVLLRSFVFIGTCFYLGYYLLYPTTPLWGAIFWGAMLGLVNLSVLITIIYDRIAFKQDLEEYKLYRLFDPFNPGEFRKMMAISTTKEATRTTVLTIQGKRPDNLFFVINGEIHIKKYGDQFDCMPGIFIGEMEYLSNNAASATVFISADTCYLIWSHAKLKKLAHKNPELSVKLLTLINRDMANKLELSSPLLHANGDHLSLTALNRPP